LLLLTDNFELLRTAFRYTRHRHPFTMDAIVVLPDHLHALWTLPSGDSDFRDSLAAHQDDALTKAFPRAARARASAVSGNAASGSTRSATTTILRDWPFLSFHRMVRLGICPREWGGGPEVAPDGGFGER
jgi:putative transposase